MSGEVGDEVTGYSPERGISSSNPEMPGLQVRMLLGSEALIPSNLELPEVTIASLKQTDGKNQVYSLLAKASKDERRQHWIDNKDDFNEQLTEWEAGFQKVFADKSKFFAENPKGAAWTSTFDKMGLRVAALDKAQVKAFYDRYLKATKEEQLKLFVTDFIKSQHKADGSIDAQQVIDNKDAILWLGNVFGKHSSEVINQLISVEVALINDGMMTSLVEQTNQKASNDAPLRLNSLTADEVHLLTFLTSKPSSFDRSASTGSTQPTTRPSNPSTPAAPTTSKDTQPTGATEVFDLNPLKEFAKKDTLESKADYEQSLNEVIKVLEGKDGIHEMADLPTIIIPDLHGRRDFLVGVLDRVLLYEPYKGQRVADLLKQGKINMVLLGDGMHTEDPMNWGLYKEWYQYDADGKEILGLDGKPVLTNLGRLYFDYKNAVRAKEAEIKAANPTFTAVQIDDIIYADSTIITLGNKYEQAAKEPRKKLMDAEMVRSFGLMKMVMDLKADYPEVFHYVRGNHDDIAEVVSGYYKHANESADVKQWVIDNYGQAFLDKWAKFESLLPLVIKNSKIATSHTTPKAIIPESSIRARSSEAVKALTWDREDYISSMDENVMDNNIKNLGLADGTLWFIGHTHVAGGLSEQKVSARGNKVVRINDKTNYIFAYVPIDRPFEASTDVAKL